MVFHFEHAQKLSFAKLSERYSISRLLTLTSFELNTYLRVISKLCISTESIERHLQCCFDQPRGEGWAGRSGRCHAGVGLPREEGRLDYRKVLQQNIALGF